MKIDADIPDQRISDLLCTGFEGGIGYWAVILKRVRPPSGKHPFPLAENIGEKGDYRPSYMWYPLVQGGAVILGDSTGEKSFKNVKLDKKAIERGLKLLGGVAGGRYMADFLSGNEDADTGDVFIQLCVFGEVIFG